MSSRFYGQIAVLVLAISVFLWPQSQPRTDHQSAHLQNQKAEKPNNSDSPVVQEQTVYTGFSGQDDHAKAGKPEKQTHDWIDKLNACSTGVIAAFTVLLFLAVLWQTRTSRSTERAWIIASPVDHDPRLGFVPEAGSNLQAHLAGANQQNVFGCALKNTGNTPALLTRVSLRYLKVVSMDEIPAKPNYEGETALNHLLLVREDSIGYQSVLEPSPILSKDDFDAVNQSQMFLYAFGVVAYRDVYGRNHETRFGYLYHVPKGGDRTPIGFRRENLPPAYNWAT